MPTLIRHPFTRCWVALTSLLVVFLVTTAAHAYGRVEWAATHLKENKVGTQSNWKIEIKIFLNKAPDFAHVPVKFEFKQEVYYERYMSDESPNVQTRKVPTPNAQPIIESVDLGFLDPGSGKIESRTRFAFRISRAHGFEAGEWRVTLRNGRTGAVIGQPVTLYLDGENEVIDRRAMVFADKDKKKDEKKDSASDSDSDGTEDAPAPTTEEGSMDWEEVEEPDQNLPPPEALRKKKGCGCRVAGERPPTGAFALPLLLGAALLARRRSRRRAA